jgi:acetolactate synthase-1/2/3 large subunit
VVNDHGYTEIRQGMARAGIPAVGVDLHTPDFAALGRAVGGQGVRVQTLPDVVSAVRAALRFAGPTVIEIDAGALHREHSGIPHRTEED